MTSNLITPTFRLPVLLPLMAAGVLSFGACSTGSEVVQQADTYLSQGNSYQAFFTLQEAVEEAGGPDKSGEELESAYWRIREIYLLDRAKRQIFTDHEKDALVTLERLAANDPDNSRTARWMMKAKNKLASRITAEADELRGTGDLEGALQNYTEALFYVPGFAPALEGQRLVNEQVERRKSKASDYLNTGLRSERDGRTVQSEYSGGIAEEFDPTLQPATDLVDRSSRRLAVRIFQNAQRLEAEGNYGAAKLEFAEVTRHEPGFEGVDAAIARMDRELQSQELRRLAEGVIPRGDFDAVDELLDQAFELTDLEKGRISELRGANRKARWSTRYERVRDLEVQGEFELAIAGYKEILQEWPGGFEDAEVRIIGLEEGLEAAAQAYQEAQKAEADGKLEGARAAYARADLLLPGYKDAADQAIRLERKLKADALKESAAAPTGDNP